MQFESHSFRGKYVEWNLRWPDTRLHSASRRPPARCITPEARIAGTWHRLCAGTARFADRAIFWLPSLVLPDRNIPRVPGLEVLAWIRHQRALDSPTVLVLSDSEHPADIKAAYHLGANSHFTKPRQLKDRLEMVRQFKFWLQRSAAGLPVLRESRTR